LKRVAPKKATAIPRVTCQIRLRSASGMAYPNRMEFAAGTAMPSRLAENTTVARSRS
jgi:hypothetical protein